MSNPKECLGKAYHTPSAANPATCYRCGTILALKPQQQPRQELDVSPHSVHYFTRFPALVDERYKGSPTNELKMGDMGE